MSHRVSAQAILKSPRQRSLANTTEPVTAANIEQFRADEATSRQATEALARLGFEVTGSGTPTLSITGDKELFERVFGVRLEQRTKAAGTPATYYDTTSDIKVPPELAGLIAGVAFPEPPELFP